MFALKGRSLLVCSWISVLTIALLDHFTGYEIGFFVFYFIPVGLGAWEGGRRVGLVLALTCAVVWLVIDLTTAHPYSNEWYRYWNALIRYAAFVGLAIVLARLKALVEKERELTAKEVRELRGFLPICASCKTIRNDQGYWEQIESYIAAHSEVEFTHSICPECTQRLYPEFVKLPAHLDPSTALDAERRGMP